MPAYQQEIASTVARQNIEYLRRAYAKATDMIGLADAASIEAGRQIYHSIFSPAVEFSTAGEGVQPLVGKGPDSWVDVVVQALGPIGPTQHLVGTQLVEIQALTLDVDGSVASGEARMESYVQAWHEMGDGQVWLFLGTYFDEISFYPEVGWQIDKMVLHRVAGENRPMGEAVALAVKA
ncbi:MAG: SnoaL-like domain-containing protein [Gammaproteobacteria bacterium]|jgi:hypothetical protein|nr:SnoaL-like domain-containing protein [Gammaproteobacteria bacterium]MBT5202581.1 SnoaL-like domain-containing protein [Gammaproteobacteria bacterium]MBT5602459.1 SnoaL-like domain-containing protein [Gammaproteobacteria bacterium]MBT6245440.1 SnoaL-like domain-containing protein [Gammaproteobacteria bacterium]